MKKIKINKFSVSELIHYILNNGMLFINFIFPTEKDKMLEISNGVELYIGFKYEYDDIEHYE